MSDQQEKIEPWAAKQWMDEAMKLREERDDWKDIARDLAKRVERAEELLESTKAQCERLRERAEKADAEVKRVRDLIDRDRTGLAAALDNVRKILEGYGWLAEYGGWGSYDYTQQTVTTLRKEIGWMMDAALTAIKKGMNESGDRANSAFHPERAVDEKG